MLVLLLAAFLLGFGVCLLTLDGPGSTTGPAASPASSAFEELPVKDEVGLASNAADEGHARGRSEETSRQLVSPPGTPQGPADPDPGRSTTDPVNSEALPFDREQLKDRRGGLRRNQGDATRLATAHEIVAEGGSSPLLGLALDTLAELEPHSVAGVLQRLITADPDNPVAGTWIRSVGQRPGVFSADALHSLFQTGSRDVQIAAASVLAARGDDSLSVLYQELRAGDLVADQPEVRAEAIRDLAAAGSQASLHLLTPLLRDEDEQVRLAALNGLRQLGGVTVLEQIRPLTQDPAERVRRIATRMVETLERRRDMLREREQRRSGGR